MLKLKRFFRFALFTFLVFIVLVSTKSWGQVPPYFYLNPYQTGFLSPIQGLGSSTFGIYPQALSYQPSYPETLAFNQLANILGLYAAIGLNNSTISSTTQPERQIATLASVDATQLYPFLPILDNYQGVYGTAFNPTYPLSNSIATNPALRLIQYNQNPTGIGQYQAGGYSSQTLGPYATANSLGQPFPSPAYYSSSVGLYPIPSQRPPYRINATGITLAESYEGVWESAVFLGASGEIKLKEISQYGEEFFGGIKFKEHPVAATEGSVIGTVEGNLVTFTVHFDNPCIGTFSGSGTATLITGTYIITCFDGSYVDEGTFELVGE